MSSALITLQQPFTILPFVDEPVISNSKSTSGYVCLAAIAISDFFKGLPHL